MASHEGAGAGSILMAFVLGAISGAAVALLWAPAAGSDTRRVIGERAREGADRAATAAQQGREFMNRQRESVTAAVERGREAFQSAREQEKA